jgi:hypothetical protein
MNAAEESRLAAADQARRAAAAEAELDGLRKALADAQKQARELGWQLRMVVGPGVAAAGGDAFTIGGASSRQGGSAGDNSWFGDMLGCGANFVRK